MSRLTWRPSYVTAIFLYFAIENKQAANIGGGNQNELSRLTTSPPATQTPQAAETTTVSRGLLVSSGDLLNFTVQAGTRVTLHCRVELHDENASVSWLKRTGDSLQLLSVNTDLFKDDPRYKINFYKPSDWQLYIIPVNFTDQGYYECQVSSHPPIVHSVYLHVIDSDESNPEEATEDDYPILFTTEDPVTSKNLIPTSMSPIEGISTTKVPELEIADERNLPIKNKFYNSGSTIELRCLIAKIPQPTQFIIWKHNSTILNYDTTRGGISVKTDILPDGAKSQLYIANVGPSDSGNYSCSLGEETVTSVSVVVITGETPAAMQHGSAASVNVGLLTLLSVVLAFLS